MSHNHEPGAPRRHAPKHFALKVREVMTADVLTVGPKTSFHELVECMVHNEVSAVLVVDVDGAVVGIVTEADLIAKEAYEAQDESRRLRGVRDHVAGRDVAGMRKAAGRVAEELMSATVDWVDPDADLAQAARMMLKGHRKSLAVLEGGRLVGIITRRDLLRPMCRSDAELAQDVEALLGDRLRTPEPIRATVFVHNGVVSINGMAPTPRDARVLLALMEAIPGVVAINNGLSSLGHDTRT